jgi:hypothetical protein
LRWPAAMTDLAALLATILLAYLYTMRAQRP